jgi:hypothetical protein
MFRSWEEYGMDFDNKAERLFEETFWDILNSETSYLGKNNLKYKEYGTTCANVVTENKKLQLVLEEENAMSLTEEEVKKLIEFRKAETERYIIAEKRLLYTGARYAYYLLCKMDLIKDLKDDSNN